MTLESLDFASILASSVHDMKNSIHQLLLGLDEMSCLCTNSYECPNQKRFTQLQYEGKRVNNHLVRILSLYKIRNSQYLANIDQHSIYDLLADQVSEIAPIAEMHGITLEIDCDEGLDWFIDRDLASGIFNNVLMNALRFARKQIKLTAKAENHFLVCHIDDDGPGYPPGVLEDIHAAAGSISFKTGSTGLGLYFSSQVAALHTNKERAGEISLSNESALGGARFTLQLP